MSGSLPPGWYPAPGSGALRWWDGLRWTGEVRETGGAGDAGTPAAASGAGPVTAAAEAAGPVPAGPVPPGEPEGAPAAPAAWRAAAVEAWQARTDPEPPRRLGRWRGRRRRDGGTR